MRVDLDVSSEGHLPLRLEGHSMNVCLRSLAVLALLAFVGCAKPAPSEVTPPPQPSAASAPSPAAKAPPEPAPLLEDKKMIWQGQYLAYRKTHSQKDSITHMVDLIKHDPIVKSVVGSTKLSYIMVAGGPSDRTISFPAK
jgi:hypothetical protein